MTDGAGSLPDNVVIREAVEADEAFIRALIRSERLNPIGIDWRRFIVAEDVERNLLGCGQVKVHSDGSHELASLVVQLDWREMGIARAIVSQLKSTSQYPLWLTCRSRLTSFYERFDFVVVEDPNHMPRYFRIVSKWMNRFVRLMNRRDGLAVMKWEA